MSKDMAVVISQEPKHYPESYILRAFADRQAVGRLVAVIESESKILLSDLEVDEEVAFPNTHACALLGCSLGRSRSHMQG